MDANNLDKERQPQYRHKRCNSSFVRDDQDTILTDCQAIAAHLDASSSFKVAEFVCVGLETVEGGCFSSLTSIVTAAVQQKAVRKHGCRCWVLDYKPGQSNESAQCVGPIFCLVQMRRQAP